MLGHPVSVRKFLNKLLVDADHLESEKLGDDPMLHDNVCVYFSHFTEIDYIPNKATLSKFMERGSALKLKVNQIGVYLLIPAFKDNVLFGVILVKVKNQEKGNNRKEKIEKVYIENAFSYESDLCDLKTIGIYIVLREKLKSGVMVSQITFPQPPTEQALQTRWKELHSTSSKANLQRLEIMQELENLKLKDLKILLDNDSPNFNTSAACVAFIRSTPKKHKQNTFVVSLPALINPQWIPAPCLEIIFNILDLQNPSGGPVLAFSAPNCFSLFDRQWQEYRQSL